MRQFESSFNNWKNINIRIDHFHSMKKMIVLQKCKILDVELINQFNNEKTYWFQVLKRIITVTKFLSTRRLAFRRKSEIFGCLKMVTI